MTKDVTAQEIERNAKWAERWEKVHAFGRWRFLLLRGVVGWAVPWGVLMLVWTWWYVGHPPTLRIVLTTLAVATAGGLLVSAYVWWRAERRYRRWLATQSNSAARVFE
jgi:hypothetical protein